VPLLLAFELGENKPEAYVVVPIVRRVVVTVSGTHVLCIVVPRATAQHAVSALTITQLLYSGWRVQLQVLFAPCQTIGV
jgi:hypothetical protein